MGWEGNWNDFDITDSFLDPCCAEAGLINIEIYFHFLSSLNNEMARVVEILPHGR